MGCGNGAAPGGKDLGFENTKLSFALGDGSCGFVVRVQCDDSSLGQSIDANDLTTSHQDQGAVIWRSVPSGTLWCC